MELDSLKEIWKNVGKQVVEQHNQEPLLEMVKRSSQTPIAKMKRNLRWELGTVIVLFGWVAIYYFTAMDKKFSIIAWMYVFLMLLFSVYFYYKNKLLSEMQCAACMVKSNLEKQVTILERYVRFYLIAGTVMLPLLALFLWFIMYSRLPGLHNSFTFLPTAAGSLFKTGVFWLVATGLFTVVMYYLNKWYIHKLYGRHIQKLRSILSEMEEE